MRKILLATSILMASAIPAFAHDFKAGDLTIDHPIVFETTKTARAGGGYLTITNDGETADRLLSVEADFPRVEVHDTVMDGDVAKMQKVDGLEIPAGETVELSPGGLHVMFMGLPAPFVEGEEVNATLVFENAGRVDIVFNVEVRPAHDHGDHSDHSDH